MDASQRWETEALRSGSQFRKTPPVPSAEQQAPKTETHDPDANWVTLKDAEAATGIPIGTLRKWSRKSAIPSYLESDGDLTLRMVDLDAVIEHAHALGRVVKVAEEDQGGAEDEEKQDEQEDQEESDDVDSEDDEEEQDESDEIDVPPSSDAPMPPKGTLIVPLDAWNKMLNQLGNLHEAGQQLAEARERAAKAETEAKFLRERLAEFRAQNTEHRTQNTEVPGVPIAADTTDSGIPISADSAGSGVSLSRGAAEGRSPDAGGSSARPTPDEKATASYWRYLTLGWRDRKKRGSSKT
jgi:hypothetical protein